MGVGDGPMPSHDKVPNLKLVMNPEGKLHDWTDLPEDEVPEMAQVAAGTGNPEAAHAMVENLQACKGRGNHKLGGSKCNFLTKDMMPKFDSQVPNTELLQIGNWH